MLFRSLYSAWHSPVAVGIYQAARNGCRQLLSRMTARISSTIGVGDRLMSVSQNRSTDHPSSASLELFLESRSLLDWTFCIQYEGLFPATSFWDRDSQSRPCQKSPSQKIATRCRGNTISGLPGSSFTFLRYRNPTLQSNFRRASSWAVSLERFLRLTSELNVEAADLTP
jgi:hypothetical protein